MTTTDTWPATWRDVTIYLTAEQVAKLRQYEGSGRYTPDELLYLAIQFH